MSLSNEFGAASGDEALALMRHAYVRLLDYYRWADCEFEGSQNEMGIEAYTRLSQTIRLVEMVVEFLAKASARPTPPKGAGPKEMESWLKSGELVLWARSESKNEDDMQIFTECAYLLAWRSGGAIRGLCGLSKFKPKGVRDVRNKLIEHVDGKDSGVLICSFGWGAECGPVVRALRTVDKKDIWPDAGLFINMNEFSNDLITCIDQLLDGKDVPPASQ